MKQGLDRGLPESRQENVVLEKSSGPVMKKTKVSMLKHFFYLLLYVVRSTGLKMDTSCSNADLDSFFFVTMDIKQYTLYFKYLGKRRTKL